MTIEPPDASESWATGINDAGEIVGRDVDNDTFNTYGFTYQCGSYDPTNFGRAYVFSNNYDIGNSSQIVGMHDDRELHIHGFVVSAASIVHDLDIPCTTWVRPGGINNAGVIVGDYTQGGAPQNYLVHGGFILWSNGDFVSAGDLI
jgi:uncharacterized membrane protein